MEHYDEVVELKSRPRAPNQPNILASTSNPPNMSTPPPPKNMTQKRDIGGGPTIGAIIANAATAAVMPAFEKIEAQPSRSMRKPVGDESNEGSETDESSESDLKNRQQTFVVDHKEWENLDVSPDIKEMFQYIVRYSPSKVSIDYVLQPFIPEFIPAVGDIDAFLKVVPPKLTNERRATTAFIAKLGVDVLDEPSGQQSEPALLHMKLRSVSTQVRHSGGPAGAGAGGTSGGSSRLGTGAHSSGQQAPLLVSVAKSSKEVERWIGEIQNLHVNQPYPMVMHRRKPLQDIDALMNEWPPELERTLNAMGFPNAHLDCSLEMYLSLICAFFDIVIPATESQSDYIFALYTLFNLYLAVKNPIN